MSVSLECGLFTGTVADPFDGATVIIRVIRGRQLDPARHRAQLWQDGPVAASSEFVIAGPLRSFLRMAGISQKIAPEEVLPLLSRNVFAQGYDGSGRRTEFLILLSRYVVQARELAGLAATDGMIIR